MTFWQNMFSTFIGAVLGFAFSIVIYFIKTKMSNKSKKDNLEKSLLKELEYNDNFLNGLKNKLNKVIERVAINDKNVFHYFIYSTYSRYFMHAYFNEGYLFEKLSIDDITNINDIFMKMSEPYQQIINESIEQWKQGTLSQADLLGKLAYERDTMENYIKIVSLLKVKIRG